MDEYEYIHKMSTSFYVNSYGMEPELVKKELEDHNYNYIHADPDEVVNAIVFLNICSHETELFWLGRAMISLELPMEWESYFLDDNEGEFYIYKPIHFRLNIHPCFLYIKILI